MIFTIFSKFVNLNFTFNENVSKYEISTYFERARNMVFTIFSKFVNTNFTFNENVSKYDISTFFEQLEILCLLYFQSL